MELRHLRYFVAVAEAGNFTRAAQGLGIGQPPLSQQIKDLEAELDVRLFRRVPHGAELTAGGEAFLVEARATLAAAERARDEAQRAARGESGRLRIGFTASAALNPLVPGAIRAFARAYPQVALDLDEANTGALLAGLHEGRLDVAFLRPEPRDLDALASRKLPDEAMLVVLPGSHPCAGRRTVALRDLARDRFILFPRTMGASLHDAIISACRAAGFEPLFGQVAPQMSSMIALVAAEAGVAIVPASLRQIAIEGVRYLAITDAPAPKAHLALGWRRGAVAVTLANFLHMTT